MLPFKQTRLDENTVLRVFSEGVDDSELVWHRDRNDRLIEVIEGEGWKLQIENDIPRELTAGSRFFVAAREYHRVIKGRGDLRVRIFEDKDQNDDGENDFEDVKIARMKASGMSDAEIKKKHPELFENKKSNHDPNYGAPEGSKRDKQLDQTKEDLKRAKKLRKDGKAKQAKELEQRAYRRRERMEKQEREKPGYKNKPRKDTKKESYVRMPEKLLRELIRNVLLEKLSKKTKETLKKKAEKRGLTPSSVYAEFRKGLAAFNTSGSKKGMSAHQWAHARVNSATPSKPWAVVKKSKKKKKKKK